MHKFFKKRSNQILSVFVLLPFLAQTFVTPLFALDELIFKTQIDVSEDILDEGISDPKEIAKSTWITSEESATTSSSVVLGETYIYPNNSDVTVVFSSLPEISGTLTIKTVYLTDEQVKVTNAASNVAYDITTDMVDGTFNYDLTLPKVGESNMVVYAESVNELVDAKDISNVIENESSLKIEDLDHFTTFVVVVDDDGDGNVDSNFSAPGWSIHNSGYNGDHKYVTKEQTGEIATWTYTGPDINNGAIFVSWTQWYDHATNAKYTSSVFGDVYVDQQKNSSQLIKDDNGVWSGWYRVKPDSIYSIKNLSGIPASVTLGVENGVTNGNLSADAVAFVDLNEAPNIVWVDDNYSLNNTGYHFWGYDAFSKIQDAISAVATNGTINVADGTYYENLTINKSLTLRSVNGAASTIIDGGLNSDSAIVNISNIDKVTVQGFTIQNASSSWGGIYLDSSTGSVIKGNTFLNNVGDIWIDGGLGSTITENTLYGKSSDNQSWGVYISNSSGNIISDNTITGKSPSMNGVIYLEYSNSNTISNNDLRDNELSYIFPSGRIKLVSSNSNVISDNIITNNNPAPDNSKIIMEYGIYLSDDSNENNLLRNTVSQQHSGIRLDYSDSNNLIEGNKLSYNYNGLELVGDGNLNNRIQYNDIFDNHDWIGIPGQDIGKGILFNATTLGGSTIIKYNNIYNNPGKAISYWGTGILRDPNTPYTPDTIERIDATHNWWGDVSGPSNELQDPKIDYMEWLCKPYEPGVESTISSQGMCSLSAPTNLGWNVASKSATPNEMPLDLQCNNNIVYTDENSVAQNWSSVNGLNVKYQREVTFPIKIISYFDAGSNNFIPFSTFGSSTGIEGLWKTRVKAYVDANSNNVIDNNEIQSGWSNSCNIFFDQTSPSISNIGIDKTYVKEGTVITITANVTDNSGISAVSADFSYNENYTSLRPTPTSVTMTKTSGSTYQVQYTVPSSWSDGTMYIKVAANDLTGSNLVRSTEYKTVLVDNTPPSTPQMLGFNNPTLSCEAIANVNVVTVDWSDSSDGSGSGIKGYNYEINYPTTTGGRATYNAFFTISHYRGSLNEGLHKIKVQAVDNAGNISEWTSLCNITSDTIAPDVQITAPASTHLTGEVEIRGTVTDANPHHYWLVIENNSKQIIAGPGQINDSTTFTGEHLLNWDTTLLAEGDYTIKLEARDSANNKDSGSSQWLVVTVDHTQPTVDLQLNVNEDGFKAVFSEDVNETDATNPANYFLDNWPTAVGENGDLSGDADIHYDSTSHTATVTFTNGAWHISPEQKWGVQNIHDLAGNVLAVTPYTEYSTPMEPPVTTVSGIDANWHNTDVEVQLTCADIDGSGCYKTYYSLDGGTTYLEGDTVTVSTEGENKITFYSEDNAGNSEPPKVSDVVKIDKTSPTINSIDTSNGLLTVISADTLSNVKSVEVQIDGGTWTPYTPGMDLYALVGNVPGTYSANVKVTDNANNPITGSTSFTISEPTSTATEAVLGTKDTKTTTSTNTTRLLAYTNDYGTGNGGGEEEETTTDEEESKEEKEVLGETTCENTYKVSGTIYYDKNNNGIYDEDEKVVEGIEVNIYNNSEELEKTVTTNEKGYWEASLCKGEYNTQVKGAEDQSFVLGDSDTTLNISVEKKTNWWLIALITSAVIILLGVLIDKYKKGKED